MLCTKDIYKTHMSFTRYQTLALPALLPCFCYVVFLRLSSIITKSMLFILYHIAQVLTFRFIWWVKKPYYSRNALLAIGRGGVGGLIYPLCYMTGPSITLKRSKTLPFRQSKIFRHAFSRQETLILITILEWLWNLSQWLYTASLSSQMFIEWNLVAKKFV